MPCKASIPSGGFKIALEYANKFSRDGYIVHMIYPHISIWSMYTIKLKIIKIIGFYINKYFRNNNCKKWFNLDTKIKECFVWSLSQRFVPKADIYIATAIETSIYLNEYNIDESKKFYFIQGFENWRFPDDKVIESYHYKINKIVISNWLMDIMQNINEEAMFIPNGFDFTYFAKYNSIESRNKNIISCIYNNNVEIKGINVLLDALYIVKKQNPNLSIMMFGTSPRPNNLEDWFIYKQSPNKDEHNYILNSSAIFVGASNIEGWGLPIGEAMQCGCAIACTDNKGYLEMAKDEQTALVSPVGDSNSLAYNILRLINDNDLRHRIAKNGYDFIQQFDINKSYQNLKDFIIKKNR